MGGQKKGSRDRRVLTTVALAPTRSSLHFVTTQLQLVRFCFSRCMGEKWLKATIALASMLGSTYLALMQRSECVIKTEAHTIDMDLNEQDY